VGALTRFLKRCQTHGTRVLIVELNARAHAVLKQMGVLDIAVVEVLASYDAAVERAGAIAAAG
jgi:anti-anti-sigma regulatory factor